MLKSVLSRYLVLTAAVLLLAIPSVSGLVSYTNTAFALDYPQGDCDPNAVMKCGFDSMTALKNKYRFNQGRNLKAIFAYFGIPNEAAMDGMVRGRVTKSGDVYVGSKKVATQAITAGRLNMPGSTKIPGIDAYTRKPSVSFRSDSLEAFVQMKGGSFRFAIIMSCGNPVKAKPVPRPTPRPQKPQQPKRPDLEIKKDVRVFDGSNLSGWEEERAIAAPGNELVYHITIKNNSETTVKNVKLHDSLPQGITHEPNQMLEGSPEITDETIGKLVGQGIVVGDIPKGDIREVTFNVLIEDVQAGDCQELRNVADTRADQVPEKEDDVTVEVCQPEQPSAPPQQPEQPKQPEQPRVQGSQTILPVTGAVGAAGAFSITSFLGIALYKLKDFYLAILR